MPSRYAIPYPTHTMQFPPATLLPYLSYPTKSPNKTSQMALWPVASLPSPFIFFIKLVARLTLCEPKPLPAAPANLPANPVSLPALLPLSLTLVTAFFHSQTSAGLILPPVPLYTASSALRVIFSCVFSRCISSLQGYRD